jgi:hypothetical protein
MKNEKRATAAARENNDSIGAKVRKVKGICKVLDYFRYNVGTSLDCTHYTGILRNSVTRYIDDLEDEHLLMSLGKRRDSTTHYPAKHYSADSKLWKKQGELNLFGEEASQWS